MPESSNYDQPLWHRLRLIQLCLLLALLGGLGMLLLDIRYEHRAVLAEKWQAWIPILTLSTSLVLLPIGIVMLRKLGRQLLTLIFAALIVTGCLGFYFHSQGKPVERMTRLFQTVMQPPGHLQPSDDDSAPPILAPLALVGLGAIGILASLLYPTIQSTSET